MAILATNAFETYGKTLEDLEVVPVNEAAAAVVAIKAAASGKKVLVMAVGLTMRAAGTLSFRLIDNTVITGPMEFVEGGGFALANTGVPHFFSALSGGLELSIGVSGADGFVTILEVTPAG